MPEWPAALDDADIARVCFALDFMSPCTLQPADFLGLGRRLRLIGRQLLDRSDSGVIRQWEDLFQPPLSADPVARKKFQKPAPAFVINMPLDGQRTFDVGDSLTLEVLFLGRGIPSISDFLRCLIHLGHLGLVSGEGRYEVTEVKAYGPDGVAARAWRQDQALDTISCPVLKLNWLVQREFIAESVMASFTTPTRLLLNGKPLRKPRFTQIFPFMLRRVTSMLYTHCGTEPVADSARLIEKAGELEVVAAHFNWVDWRSLSGQQMSVGGFVGDIHLRGDALDEIFWLLAVASLFGIGKGASYGAGSFTLNFV